MIHFKNGKVECFTPNEDQHIARFTWGIFYSFNLSELKEFCKECGGKVLNEMGAVVFDSGKEYSHKFFQNFILPDTKYSLTEL